MILFFKQLILITNTQCLNYIDISQVQKLYKMTLKVLKSPSLHKLLAFSLGRCQNYLRPCGNIANTYGLQRLGSGSFISQGIRVKILLLKNFTLSQMGIMSTEI